MTNATPRPRNGEPPAVVVENCLLSDQYRFRCNTCGEVGKGEDVELYALAEAEEHVCDPRRVAGAAAILAEIGRIDPTLTFRNPAADDPDPLRNLPLSDVGLLATDGDPGPVLAAGEHLGGIVGAWAAEEHPRWCTGGPGCGGLHFSHPTDIPATGDPEADSLVSVVTGTGPGGGFVEVSIDGLPLLRFTPGESDQLALALVRHAADARNPGQPVRVDWAARIAKRDTP